VALASGKVAPAGTIHCSEVAVPAFPVRVSMRLGSMFCFASPPRCTPSRERALARQVLTLFLGAGVSDDDQLGIWILLQLERDIVQFRPCSVVHAPGLLELGYSHSFTLLACGGGGGGGGGLLTVTVLEVEAVKPRESVQVALTVIGPAEAPWW